MEYNLYGMSDDDIIATMKRLSRIYQIAWQVARSETEMWRLEEAMQSRIPHITTEQIASRLVEHFFWFSVIR